MILHQNLMGNSMKLFSMQIEAPKISPIQNVWRIIPKLAKKTHFFSKNCLVKKK